jgi:hypothetical protein
VYRPGDAWYETGTAARCGIGDAGRITSRAAAAPAAVGTVALTVASARPETILNVAPRLTGSRTRAAETRVGSRIVFVK